MLVAIKQLKILKHEANVKTEGIYLSALEFQILWVCFA